MPNDRRTALAAPSAPSRYLASKCSGPSGPTASTDTPVGRLGRADPLVAVAHVQLRREQQRFEPVLAEVAQRRRRDRQHLVALALVGKGADHVAAQLRHPVDEAGLVGRERGVEDRAHRHAGLAPDLEGAGVDRVGRGRALRALALLQHDGGEADLVAEVGGRQAGGPATDDDDVDVGASARSLRTPPRSCRRRAGCSGRSCTRPARSTRRRTCRRTPRDARAGRP